MALQSPLTWRQGDFHIQHEPVIAPQGSWGYNLSKQEKIALWKSHRNKAQLMPVLGHEGPSWGPRQAPLAWCRC
jgi:hypothetical protein